MSNLTVASLSAPSSAGNVINVPSPNVLYAPGHVIQLVPVRTDLRATYASANSGNGTLISELNISITPKKINSLIVCEWMINGEMSNNNVFVIWKNGGIASNGYNTIAGNVRWSGYVSAEYDNNDASTPSNYKIIFIDSPNSTGTQTYGVAVRSAGAAAYTFALNRPLGSSGADDNEVTVSAGFAMEIAG